MPEPRDAAKVRERLVDIIEDVDSFATEDRERAYMYAVLAWRAAGFTTESKLFPASDDRILLEP